MNAVLDRHPVRRPRHGPPGVAPCRRLRARSPRTWRRPSGSSPRTLAPYRSPVAPLVQHLKHYRGKRLRPALLLLTAKACGKVTPAHHTLAAAVEMIHTATLVHDDVLDEADVRRHARTVNAGWGEQGRASCSATRSSPTPST